MAKVVVVGSMNADLTVQTHRLPRPGETVAGSELQIFPGGKSSNQAVVAARQGADVTLIGLVGDDPHGELLRARAAETGVDITAVGVLPDTATGTAMIAVDESAENFIIISPGANGRMTPEVFTQHSDRLDGAGALCLCLEIDQATVLAAAQEAQRRGVPVILNLSPSAPLADGLLEATDVLLVNEHELTELVGGVDLDDAPRALAELGITRAVVTLGSRGALVIDAGTTEIVASVEVTAVDTTGCGDAFTGSLAYRLAEGDDLVEAARFGARVAAFAATRPGAQNSYPTVEELRSFLA